MKQRVSLVYSLAISIAVATFLIYLPALQNGFVEWDDNQYIFENNHIHYMDSSFFRWAFSSFYAGNWHPLTWVSHALDYTLWGLNPIGHHLTNNILHAVNTFLVVLLVVRLIEAAVVRQPSGRQTIEGLGSRLVVRSNDTKLLNHRTISRLGMVAAGTAGLLFGIHPVHVESVAWVAERKDLLCALFYLLSVTAYASYSMGMAVISDSSHRPYKIYLLSLVFFSLALMSKPMAVSLPVVLLILDWYPFQRIISVKTFLTSCFEKVPFIAFALISSLLTILAQKAGGAMGLMDVVPLSTRVIVAFHSLAAYLVHMVLPFGLVFFYPYPKSVSLLSPEYLLAFILVTGLTVMCIILRRRRLWPAVWAYYLITLVPVIGLVQVGSQSMADRYTYLPSIGPFLLLGLAAAKVMEYAGRHGAAFRRIAASIGVAIVVVLSTMTVRQIGTWSDSITLWSSVINKIPTEAFFAYHNRGLAYSRLGEYDKAIEDYHKAIELKPGYADTYSNLGIALLKKGLREEAIRNYRIAISLDPGLPNAHRNLAVALYMSGRLEEALAHYLIVAELRPGDAGAHADLGAAYGAVGRFDEAIVHLEKALQIDPRLADAHYNIAAAYQMVGRTDDANMHYEAARLMKPKDAETR